MSGDLYLPGGYINMGRILDDPHYMRVVISARGPGKTFGALSQAVIKGIRFLYLRRTQEQAKITTSKDYHPFKKINAFFGWNIEPRKANGLTAFEDPDTGKIAGYAGALSTFRNVRGFDGSDIDLVFYDEAVPEKDERVTFDDWYALLNVLETVGRNRELEGSRPLKVLLCANAEEIYGHVLAGLGIENDLLEMRLNGEEEREISPQLKLYVPICPEFVEKKADTHLYLLTQGTRFSEMALDNKFKIRSRDRIRKRPLAEFVPLCGYRGTFIYRHKSDGTYYVSAKKTGSPKIYEDTKDGHQKFLAKYGYLESAHTRGRVFFETLHDQAEFFLMF